MSIYQKIQSDLIAAQKAKEADRVATLRLMVNDIKNVAINAGGDRSEISDDDTVKALTKAVKQRKDSIQMFTDNSREDLAQKEKAEMDIISEYLPQMMSIEDIEAALKPIVETQGKNNFGLLMKSAMQELKGKADAGDIKLTLEKLIK